MLREAESELASSAVMPILDDEDENDDDESVPLSTKMIQRIPTMTTFSTSPVRMTRLRPALAEMPCSTTK